MDGNYGKLKMHGTKLIEFNPTKFVCMCGRAFPSCETYGTHVDRAIATPAETPTQAVCDVLADHLGDLDMEFGFHVFYTHRGLVRCGCGNEYKDSHAWRVHLAETLLKGLNVPDSPSLPFCLTYEDWDDSSEDSHPQVGDYGVAVRENTHGQEEIPFHIVREEHTGLPVALLNTRLYAEPEDDIEDGQYMSLFQLYLDGFMLSRTGRKRNKDAEA